MKYDAFISYRHTPLDLEVAEKLHRALETYHVPKSVRKATGKKKIRRVFRDREELPTSSSLTSNIDEALQESEYLIVICSPDTPKSMWVEREISRFIEMHDRAHVLALLIDGEPSDSFPEALVHDGNGNNVEPLAADIRSDTARGRWKKFKVEKLRLLSALLGCSFDDLKQRQRERRMKKIAALSAAAALLMLAFGVYSFYTMQLIKKNYRQSQRNESQYLAEKSLTVNSEGDARLAALIAKEALPSVSNDRPYVPQAEYAMQQALGIYVPRNTFSLDYSVKSNFHVANLNVNDDATMAVTVNDGGEVNVWDTENGKKTAAFPAECDSKYIVSDAVEAFIKDGRVVTVYDKCVKCRDLSGNVIWTSSGEDKSYVYAAFSQKTGYVAAIESDSMDIFDIKDGKTVKSISLSDTDEYSFGGHAMFSSDGMKLAAGGFISSISGNSTAKGRIYLIDIKSGRISTAELDKPYIVSVRYNEDDTLTAASTTSAFDRLQDMSADYTEDYVIQKIDTAKLKSVWSSKVTTDTTLATGSSLQLRELDNKYTVVSVDNKVAAFDAADGRQISSFTFGTNVIGTVMFKNSTESGLAIAIEQDGRMNYIDFINGSEYKDNDRELDLAFSDMYTCTGHIFLQRSGTYDIVDLRSVTGSGYKEIDEYTDTVEDMKLSPDESTYAVKLSSTGTSYVEFHKSQDNSLINTWKSGDQKYLLKNFFYADKSHAVFILSDGSCQIYTIETGKTKVIKNSFNEDTMGLLSKTYVTDDCRYILSEYDGSAVIIRSTDGRKYGPYTLEKDVEGGRIKTVTVNPKSKVIYYVTDADGLCSYSIGSKKTVKKIGGDINIFRYVAEGSNILLSNDGKSMAMACADSTLKLVDLKSGKVIHSIPFYCYMNCFLSFSPDSKILTAQGDDKDIKLVDTETFEVLSERQNAEKISSADYFEDGKTEVLRSAGSLYIYDMDTCGIRTVIDGGRFISPVNDIVMSEKYDVTGTYPYLSLEEMLSEEEKQYGDEKLGTEERAALFS